MPPVSLLPARSFRDSRSERVNDLVVFYTYLYNFWFYKGKWNAVLHRFTDFANCLILTVLVFVFSLMFDWDAALTCEGEKCANAKLIHSPKLPSTHYILAWVFLCSTFMVSLWELKCLIEAYYLYGEVHQYVRGHITVGFETPFHYYQYKFRKWKYQRSGHSLLEEDYLQQQQGVGAVPTFPGGSNTHNNGKGGVGGSSGSGKKGPPPLLEDMDWASFLHIVTRDCLRKDKGITGYKTMDELKVVQVMLMMPNYQTALHHHGILNKAPLCYADSTTIKMLIEASMEGYRVKDIDTAKKGTKAKLFLWTLALFLLYPFIISFMLTKLLVKTVSEMKHSPNSAMERAWSTTAQWRFRLYNEVSHCHAARLHDGNVKAAKMIHKTNAALESPVAKIAQRTAACVILVIVVASWINTPLLNFGAMFGRTLIWWLATAMTIFGIATGMNKATTREYDHTDDLVGLVRDLHYARPSWFSSAASFARDVKFELLPRTLTTVFLDFMFVLFAPLIYFWIYKSKSLGDLLDFIQEHHTDLSGIGSLCTPSTFNLRDDILRNTRGPHGEGVEGDSDDDASDDKGKGGGGAGSDSAVVEMTEKKEDGGGRKRSSSQKGESDLEKANSPLPAVAMDNAEGDHDEDDDEGDGMEGALMGAHTKGPKRLESGRLPFGVDAGPRRAASRSPNPRRGSGGRSSGGIADLPNIAAKASADKLKALRSKLTTPFGTSYELKIEKSIVSFAAIYPDWLQEYTQASEAHVGTDPLGVDIFLAAISKKHASAITGGHQGQQYFGGEGQTNLGDLDVNAVDSIVLDHVSGGGEFVQGSGTFTHSPPGAGPPTAGGGGTAGGAYNDYNPVESSGRFGGNTLESVLRTPRGPIHPSYILQGANIHADGLRESTASNLQQSSRRQQTYLPMGSPRLGTMFNLAGGDDPTAGPPTMDSISRAAGGNTAHGRQAATVGLLDEMHTSYNRRHLMTSSRVQRTGGGGGGGAGAGANNQSQSINLSRSSRNSTTSNANPANTSGYGGL